MRAQGEEGGGGRRACGDLQADDVGMREELQHVDLPPYFIIHVQLKIEMGARVSDAVQGAERPAA